MGDPPKLFSAKRLSSINRLLQCTLFALALLFISIHQIYLYSEQPITWPQKDKDKYFLHRAAFTQSPYKSIIKSLTDNKYTIIRSQCEECVEEIVKFYGYKTGKNVIQRGYHKLSQVEEVVMPVFWTIRTIVDGVVDGVTGDNGVKQDTNRVWVFWVHKNLPKEQIEQVKALQPKSSIIIVSVSATKIKIPLKGFKQAGKIDGFDLTQFLKHAKIPKKQASAFLKFYHNSISAVFSEIGPQSSNIEEFLDEQYFDINKVSTKCRELVSTFCKEGSLVKDKLSLKIKGELDNLGIFVDNGNLRWQKKENVLNYMLQSDENCTWSESNLSGSSFSQFIKSTQNEPQDQKQGNAVICNCKCQSKKCKTKQKAKKSQASSEKSKESKETTQVIEKDAKQNASQALTEQSDDIKQKDDDVTLTPNNDQQQANKQDETENEDEDENKQQQNDEKQESENEKQVENAEKEQEVEKHEDEENKIEEQGKEEQL